MRNTVKAIALAGIAVFALTACGPGKVVHGPIVSVECEIEVAPQSKGKRVEVDVPASECSKYKVGQTYKGAY